MIKHDLPRDDDGKLTSFAWPGGYPVFYLTKHDEVLCPDCANAKTDADDPVTAADVNWEDASLFCDACSKLIESAYAEDEAEGEASEE